jgi:hypothetical protein
MLVGRAVTLVVPMDPHGFSVLFVESADATIEATLEWLEASFAGVGLPTTVGGCMEGACWPGLPLEACAQHQRQIASGAWRCAVPVPHQTAALLAVRALSLQGAGQGHF